jgi:hypothetical protein
LKNAIGKTRVRVFLLIHSFSITSNEKLTERKTGTPVFPIAFVQEPKALETSHELSARGLFQTACDSCVGEAQMGKARPFEAARKSSICTHQPEQSTTVQEKCDSRRFAVKYSLVSTPSNTLLKLDWE